MGRQKSGVRRMSYLKESDMVKRFFNGVYLVTDRHQTDKRPLAAVIEEALKAGVKAVQLREKDLSAKELFDLARSLRGLTSQYRARFFINDRLDIAIAVKADGVHLGQKGFSASDVKQFLKPVPAGFERGSAPRIRYHTSLSPQALSGERFLIGVSTHSLSEARKAEEEGADFITIGPVFYTASKAGYGRPLGVEIIKSVKEAVKIPVFAIGGIKLDTISEVAAAGADGIAVISAIIGAKEPGIAAKDLLQAINN